MLRERISSYSHAERCLWPFCFTSANVACAGPSPSSLLSLFTLLEHPHRGLRRRLRRTIPQLTLFTLLEHPLARRSSLSIESEAAKLGKGYTLHTTQQQDCYAPLEVLKAYAHSLTLLAAHCAHDTQTLCYIHCIILCIYNPPVINVQEGMLQGTVAVRRCARLGLSMS